MRTVKFTENTKTKEVTEYVGENIYVTVGGVLQPVYYTNTKNNIQQKKPVFLIPKKRQLRLLSATNQAPKISRQLEIVDGAAVNIFPISVFTYQKGVSDTSGAISSWSSLEGRYTLSQPTTANQPSLGSKRGGVNGFVPLYFNREESDFMSLDTAITLTGDFSLFFYIQPIAVRGHRNTRLLGKSDDNNMYLSISEAFNESYNFSFSSSSEVVVSTTGYWQPSTKKLLITVQRKGDKIYIRENGTQVHNGVIATTDFTFDQIGKLGNSSIPTYNGNIYHFSAYDGYLNDNLAKIENSIIREAELAKE
tara:strand:- start:1704 stop:2624 length:921 start_codon:yes stop_codon:yes gene_type:complete